MSEHPRIDYRKRREMIKEGNAKSMVYLLYMEDMADGCILCTDSGHRKQYVVGYLDNGELFVAKCPAPPRPNGTVVRLPPKPKQEEPKPLNPTRTYNASRTCFLG